MKHMRFILSFALVALIAVGALTGCGDNSNTPTGGTPPTETSQGESPPPSGQQAPSDPPDGASDGTQTDGDAQDIGEGQTVFRFEVTGADGNTAAWNVHTDEDTVGAALIAVGLIEGEESSYGLYVKTVDGITADYDVDQSYWAFNIDGEYAMSGVDTTDIDPGKTYAFIYTKD
uniref:Transcobalamin-like C-terminal domain-containing protein n=1 Tax=uncultured bacterium contig00045 TaxID=1181531 RepID=A0A806JZM5_9BACT|nr:hypothetical protein [uncultured bacterium contig00045]